MVSMTIFEMLAELDEDQDVDDFLDDIYFSQDADELFETGSLNYKGYIITVSITKEVN